MVGIEWKQFVVRACGNGDENGRQVDEDSDDDDNDDDDDDNDDRCEVEFGWL